jgi:2-keto-4-pentenoate hydratase/2-oxohepta-3-ene-1,7-dioic acid hydratase in catechol pathway
VFLEPGDRVRCEIDGIGSVENPVIDWSEVGAEVQPPR